MSIYGPSGVKREQTLLSAQAVNEPRGRRVQVPVTSATESNAASAVLDRLEAVLGEETNALRCNNLAELNSFTARKAHCLLELMRAVPPHVAVSGDVVLRRRLLNLREGLQANQRLLGAHLRAVEDVSEIVFGTLYRGDADGTYAPSSARRIISV